jgi:glycosyltransferase involved in cell wall biosynthesis
VATRIGGIAETVENGTTGLLVESGDVEGESRYRAVFVEIRRASFARLDVNQRFSWDQQVMAIVPPV